MLLSDLVNELPKFLEQFSLKCHLRNVMECILLVIIDFYLNQQRDLQNLEDASDDLLMVDDESAPIPFVVGEVFINLPLEEAKVRALVKISSNIQNIDLC